MSLRLGLKCVKGLSEASGRAIVSARAAGSLASIEDLRNRVPELRKDELRKLASVGALNFVHQVNRRDALWQVERVSHPSGPLFKELQEADSRSPLIPMTLPERVDADFRGTGLTIGRHPVAHHRSELDKLGASRAIDIAGMRDGSAVCVAGWVIVRQRPGTAKGFVFFTLEDETGVANIIITPQLFDKNRGVLVDHPFLLIEGILQNQDNVVSVKAKRVKPLFFTLAGAPSHDFH